MSSTIQVQAVEADGFPFESRKKSNAYLPLTEKELYDRLQQARSHVSEGKVKDADEVISNIKNKYGL